jgi:uncharacterized surface protein with fasciclin (FAS1) repeats
MLNRFATAAAAISLVAAPVVLQAQTPAAPTAPAAPAAPAAAPAAPTAPALPPSPNLVPNGDIVSTLQASGKFTQLLKALDATNLTVTVKGTPGLTLFAPTDDAFKAIPDAQMTLLFRQSNLGTLQTILAYHLIAQTVDSSKIKGATGKVASAAQVDLALDGSKDVLKVNDADIIQADVKASNGVIHVIDKVLVPDGVALPTASAGLSGSGTEQGR